MIFIALTSNIAGLHMDRRDADASAGVWPVADNTAVGLRKIWPGLSGQRQLREALRVLQRALKPGDVDFASVSALVCFHLKAKKGVVHWV